MATIKKTYELTLDLKRKSAIELMGLVAGDNGNILRISLTNGGAALDNVDINACRAVLYIRSANGWRSQDSETEDGDITIEDGIINVELHAASYAEGENLAQLEIYTTSVGDWDTLVTTQYFSFSAAAGASESVETSDAYPALIDAINRALAAADSVVSVASAHVNENGELILTMTNGNELNAGYTRNVGEDPDHIVMTTTDGRLMAGNRLYIGEDIPDPEDYETGDIYLSPKDYTSLTAEATQVPSTSPATASFDEETGVFSFEIPAGTGEKGDKGDKGDKGAKGDPGLIQGVQIAGTDLTPDADGKVDIPQASSSSYGLSRKCANNEISSRLDTNRFVFPSQTNLLVKAALSDANRISDMTETEKTNARGVIGAVGGAGNIVVDNVLPATKAADLSDGDIYLYFPDMP